MCDAKRKVLEAGGSIDWEEIDRKSSLFKKSKCSKSNDDNDSSYYWSNNYFTGAMSYCCCITITIKKTKI